MHLQDGSQGGSGQLQLLDEGDAQVVEDVDLQLLGKIWNPCESLFGDRILLGSSLLLKSPPHLPFHLQNFLLLLIGVLVPTVTVPEEPAVGSIHTGVTVAHADEALMLWLLAFN